MKRFPLLMCVVVLVGILSAAAFEPQGKPKTKKDDKQSEKDKDKDKDKSTDKDKAATDDANARARSQPVPLEPWNVPRDLSRSAGRCQAGAVDNGTLP